MRLQGQRWRTLVSTVRLGRNEYRVVRPARPIGHAPLHEGYHGAQITVDKAAALTLGMAWSLAARSPHTIVYLPLRHNGVGCNIYGSGKEPPLDLVLLRHSLRFPVSRWKELRAKLGSGRPHTVTCRGLPQAADLGAVFAARYHREFKDILRHDITADTLFLVGSRTAFEVEGYALRELVEECPQHMHERPDAHCCAEISVDGLPQWLHVEYCRVHRVTAPAAL
ncbi:hypothetical protein HLB23_36235 [Nocardia uniformis]|uniref:Uncharacterized protein n=2 Tax=Nocardia uniformis TaxID=53432 RepID=A0A849CK41_9NOCA|nr:hypothetical protein [Nocardia uniformis]NNH75241.1 hypothetical protein [Nocardia uniformis]